jgi:nucleoid-associated protein YgaU
MQTMAKASLSEVTNRASRVDFQFNPTTISFSKKAEFRKDAAPGAKKGPVKQFKGTQATQLRLQLLLDAVEKQPAGSVQSEVERLLGWTNAKEAPGGSPPAPPELQFTWGSLVINSEHTFKGHLESIEVTYELFSRDGRPIRAQVTLSLASTVAEPANTNPTSGGERPRHSRTLRGGETLQSVAHQVYGDAGRWRAIAEVNGIDNPMRLAPGRELLLPDASELPALRA